MSTFTEDLTNLESFKALTRAMPGWANSLPEVMDGSSFVIELAPRGAGVAIGLKLPAGMPIDRQEEVAKALLERIGEEERLMRLVVLSDEMRNVGVSAEVLDPIATEAEGLARRLHPEGLAADAKG